ncbi:MAG: hypothetical protein QUS14_08400, partial [Pyrinomonadaceae bacterium]|nr:hypothetical protein [Pyrinomonadaceae bacterium]
MNQYIEETIGRLREAALRYARPERYYRGEHNLAFASEKFTNTFGKLFREFALNPVSYTHLTLPTSSERC